MIDRLEAKIDRLLPRPFDQIASEWEQLRARQTRDHQPALEGLQQIVRGLDEGEYSSPSSEGPFATEAGPTTAPRSRLPQPPPEIRLPQRRSHGGPFGPKVREKLVREALRG